MIELRQLIYLEAVHKHKSFTKASKQLYVSQPTVSAAIRSMEDDLGLKLIERGSNSVKFTEAGEALMIKIRSLISDYNDIIEEAGDWSRKANYTLRLGIASILSSNIFPIIYREFLPEHKELTIHLDEDSAHGQISKLLNGELDLAFNGLPEKLDDSELSTIPVCEREIKLIMHREHPFSQLDKVPFSLLNGESISMLSSQGVMGDVLAAAISQYDIRPNVVSEHSQIHGMLEMVMTGCSIGFVNLYPETCEIMKYEDLNIRSFEIPLNFNVGFIMKKHKYIPAIYRDFIDYISRAMRSPERRGKFEL